jgi:FkbM family methyltransferase
MKMVQCATVGRDLRSRVHLKSIQVARCLLNWTGETNLISCWIWLLGKIFGNTGRASLHVDPDIILNVALADEYWMRVGLAGEYEADVFQLLSRLAVTNRETLFNDCGANIGWWSLIAEKRFKWHCIAVEAGRDVVMRLVENRRSSGAAFEIVNQAIWSRDREPLEFVTGEAVHTGGHLKNVRGFLRRKAPDTEQVTSTTIDTLVDRWLESNSAEQIIVKIDVEGAEEHALAGARRTIARGAFVIYEDHGSDKRCGPTRAIIEAGMLPYAIVKGALRPIRTLEAASRMKTCSKIGYNFVACLPGSPYLRDFESAAAAAGGGRA